MNNDNVVIVQHTFMRCTRIQQSCKMFMSKRNRNRNVIASDAPATTSHVVNDDARITHVDTSSQVTSPATTNVDVASDVSSQVIASDTTHANVNANVIDNVDVREYERVRACVRARVDERDDAYNARCREIVRLLHALRNDASMMSRDKKGIRRALRDRDYYISHVERRASTSRIASIINASPATTPATTNA